MPDRLAPDIAQPRLALSLIHRRDRVLDGTAEYFIDCLKSKALPD
ncbi:hypothetical protein PQR66_30240 [Paraburkholderia agricolaris]|uniref:LysR family transcriptional regulator n=1 Tax=Paraburkholderia agricolaris TaxID=2152888 RepID=A0ABW8ZWW6_9BURK